jgi:hypothetical protein
MSGRRQPPSGLRTLGAPPAGPAPRPRRSRADAEASARAAELLRAEFERALALKARLAEEARAGEAAKGRAARQAEKLRSLVASLEGMSRFALALGLLTPAESRAIWATYIRRGLYEGWR